MSTFLHYVHCKDALLDCSAPGGERCESLTWVDEIQVLYILLAQRLMSILCGYIEGILPKGPYTPCLRMADVSMADRALLAGYPWYENSSRSISRVYATEAVPGLASHIVTNTLPFLSHSRITLPFSMPHHWLIPPCLISKPMSIKFAQYVEGLLTSHHE